MFALLKPQAWNNLTKDYIHFVTLTPLQQSERENLIFNMTPKSYNIMPWLWRKIGNTDFFTKKGNFTTIKNGFWPKISMKYPSTTLFLISNSQREHDLQ